MALFHSEKGSVNYTIVGSPTITNGVASGFSANDYLIATQAYPAEITSYEKNIRFKHANSGGTYQVLFGGTGYDRVIFTSNTYLTISMRMSTGTIKEWGVGYLPVTVDNWYVMNIKFENGTVIFNLYSDEGTLLTTKSTEFDAINSPNTTPRIGQASADGGGFFNGSIDLNNTYITVNGQAWFGVCPIEVKHIDYGTPVDYTVVGSPTIMSGVVSGFSNANYLNLPSISFAGNDFETVINYRYPENATSFRLGFMGSFGSTKWQAFCGKTGVFRFYASGTQYFPQLNSKDYIYIKIVKTGNTLSVSQSNDGVTWVNQEDFANLSWTTDSVDNQIGSCGPSDTVEASVNLNNSYIKVNGKLWFFRPATNYVKCNDKLVFADSGLNLSGTNTYTVVGSPVIVDNVASGFSENDKLNLPALSATGGNPFEMQFAFTSNTTTVNGLLILYGGSSNTTRFGVYSSNRPTFRFHIVGESAPTFQQVAFDTVTSMNTKYIAKAVYDGTTVNCYLYDGSGNLLETKSATGSFDIEWGNACNIGASTNAAYDGSVDLNNTYIKVNGDLWFYGKNYATQNIAPVPAGYPIGDTTTSAIGWVDMRTQTFTAAPEGAVLAKDEVSEESES